jgi:hypothetical protein
MAPLATSIQGNGCRSLVLLCGGRDPKGVGSVLDASDSNGLRLKTPGKTTLIGSKAVGMGGNSE